MTRSFSALDFVSLPTLSSAGAFALGQQLIAVARLEPGLPPLVAPVYERLGAAHVTLGESRTFMHEVQDIDAGAAAEADLVVDTNWGAFYSYLQGWARLSTRGEAVARVERARQLVEGVFPGGLRFLRLPYKIEWAESRRRLDRLRQPDYAEHVEALGAGPFVEAIDEAFRAYGAALRMTDLKAEGKAQIKVREPLDNFVASLRAYVLHVTTHASSGGEGSAEQALAERLLKPLATWQTKAPARKGKGAPAGEGEPGEGGEEPTDAG
ncbi:MAG TPA: hypothetical protein VFS43_46585 [Polyangiaceae bacterium]|nr:hypothetical protein [Polyangiaceae bacterium]